MDVENLQKTRLACVRVFCSGMGFLEMPVHNHKSPSTKLKNQGQEFSVELLTPLRGRETAKPVKIPELSAFAEPVRFPDYLRDDIQAAVLLYKHGHCCPVNITYDEVSYC